MTAKQFADLMSAENGALLVFGILGCEVNEQFLDCLFNFLGKEEQRLTINVLLDTAEVTFKFCLKQNHNFVKRC